MMKEYENLKDEELFELLWQGQEGLEDYLINKYKGMVLKLSLIHISEPTRRS